MAERKYGLLTPSLQAQLHYQALLSRVPESGPLERVINNDPATYHTEASSYLPTNIPVDLSVPPLMFGAGTKDSTMPTFKPNPQVMPPSLQQLTSLLRAVNAPTTECVTANDYALVLSSQLRRHFDLTLPISTTPQLSVGEQAAKRKLMLALDDDGGSLEMARELIKRLRNTIAEQQGRIDELLGVKIGLDAIMTDAKNIRAALEDVRQTVKYQYLDSQDLVIKCGDAFKEMSGVDVFSSKAQLSTNASGKLANSQSGGLSVIAQEQLKMELERAGVVGGDPFKDRLTTCLYTLSTMKRFITVALQRTPLNPDEAPADAARFDWEHDDSVEGKRFRRKFPSVQNLARKLGVSAHAPKDRPSEGLPSFMEPLANYNTPSQELALVKSMVAMARDVASAVQLISVLADKAGESVGKSIRVDSTATSYKSSSQGGGGDADTKNKDDGNDDDDENNTDSALRIVSLEGDLRVTNEKLAVAEARLAALEGGGDVGTKSPRSNSRKSLGNPSPAKGSPAKGAGKSSTKAPPPANPNPKQKPATPSSTQKSTPSRGIPPRLSKTELLLERPGTPAPARQGSASMSTSLGQMPPTLIVPPAVDTEEQGMQTGEEVYGMAEMDVMHQTNQQLEMALASKSERVVELEDELQILQGRLRVLDRSSSSSLSDDSDHDVDEEKYDVPPSEKEHSQTDHSSTDASSTGDALDRELSTTASAFGSPTGVGGVAAVEGGEPSVSLTQYHSDNNLQFGKATKSTSSRNESKSQHNKRRRRRSNPRNSSSSPRKGSLEGKHVSASDVTGDGEAKLSRSHSKRRSSSVKGQAVVSGGVNADDDDDVAIMADVDLKKRKSKTHVSRKRSKTLIDTTTALLNNSEEAATSPTARRRSSSSGSKGQGSQRPSRDGTSDTTRDHRQSSTQKDSQSENKGAGDICTSASRSIPISTSVSATISTPDDNKVRRQSSLRLSGHDDEYDENGVRLGTVPTEQFALHTFAPTDVKTCITTTSGDPLPRRDTAPSLRDDVLSNHMGIGSSSSQLNSASSNNNATFIATTSVLPPKSTSSPVSNTNAHVLSSFPAAEAAPPQPQSLTPAHIAEVRHRALAGKKGLGTTTPTSGARGATTSVVDKLRNALSSPLPPISEQEARTLAAMNGPPTTHGSTTTPPPRVANVRVTEQTLPDGDVARAAAVEQIRLQLMSMSAASPQRHGAALTRGDGSSLSPTTSRQIVFAPASPMPGHDNPEGLRRL